MSIRRLVFAFTFLTLLVLQPLTANATTPTYDAIYVFGDSYYDVGNIFIATKGAEPLSPPYYNGRFSNGPLAPEYLAAALHAPLTSFAWGGATTGIGNSGDGGTQTSFGTRGLPGMETELATTLGSIPPALTPTSLFIVWGGPDDFISGGTPQQAVTDILTIVGTLQLAGATHILVPGMVDLSLTPEFAGNPFASGFSAAFNLGLKTSLPKGATYFDTAALLESVINNPGAYGFTNVTQPCLVGLTPCSNPNQYLFWDNIHPTTAADQILAGQFANAVPEPSTLVLLGTAVAAIAGVLRRKLSAQRLPKVEGTGASYQGGFRA